MESCRAYIRDVNAAAEAVDADAVAACVSALEAAYRDGRQVFVAGNGGSAATSAHFANDLSVGTKQLTKPFKVMSLVDNVATLTAIGNDYGYDKVFSRQVSVYGEKGDLLVGISASGNSPNLLDAFKVGKEKGMITIAITAFDGGRLKEMSDCSLHVPTNKGEYGPAEDAHMVLDHLITNYLQSALGQG